MERVTYSTWIEKLSQKKFLFLSGPRQVGKTTLGDHWVKTHGGLSLNWDIPEQRQRILLEVFTKKVENLTFSSLLLDEVHKYQRWKSALKGLFDRKLKNLRLLVTGSAKLDTYNKGGDSLLGRYEYLRIHPLTLGELSAEGFRLPPSNWAEIPFGSENYEEVLKDLENLSGFPEPFLSKDVLEYNRWAIRRRESLIKHDLRDISEIRLLSLVEQLVLLLPSKICSPLSINSLKTDLQVGFDTVNHWIEILERLYFLFRLPPFSKKIQRGLKKEKKVYFFDWAAIQEPAGRFENLVASHLLKSVHLWTDLGYGDYRLHYYRDKDKKEIDFILTKDQTPVVAIECKLEDEQVSESFTIWKKYYPSVPCYQIVRTPHINFKTAGGVHVVSAGRFLHRLN